MENSNKSLAQENASLRERVSLLSGEKIGELDITGLEELDHLYRELMVTVSQRMKKLKELQAQANKCVICLEGKKEMALIPCGHKVTLDNC